jgi:hypothetical protein
MDDLRIVRGNTFHTVSTVEARTYAGAIIPDFHLTDATDISVNIITDDLKMAAQFEVTGNDIDILWKDIPKGKYGIECLGIYQGVEWRFANRFVLTIVENNAAANIPPNCIIREDFYTIDATTLLMPVISGGGGVQSDWDESDTSSMAYIKHKPTNVSAFTNDAGYIKTETDPTVPSWAKQSTKPTYTAQEVGALPSSTSIPSALADLSDDTTHRVVTDAEKSTWSGKQDALVSGTSIKTINNESLLGSGNISISGGSGEEYVIEAITFNGNSVPVSNKTAAITANIPTVPTNVSAFTNDAGYLTQHQDISGKANIADLATVATSGSYNDLSNKPTIPTVPTNVSAFTNDAGYITSSSITNKANKITIVNYGTSSTTTTLSENIYYIWGEVASLTLTLGTPADASKLSEYMFEFVSGSTPTVLSLPSSVKWPETPTIEANKKYQVSIVRDIALIVGVSTS